MRENLRCSRAMVMTFFAHTADVIVSMLRCGDALDEDFAIAMDTHATVREAVRAVMEVSE